MLNCYGTTGKRDLSIVGFGKFDESRFDRPNYQADVNSMKTGMESVGFECNKPLVGYVTESEVVDHIEEMLRDGKQHNKDMFALCIFSMVALIIN